MGALVPPMLSSGIMHLKELHIRLEGQVLPFYSNGEGEGLIPIEIGRVMYFL